MQVISSNGFDHLDDLNEFIETYQILKDQIINVHVEYDYENLGESKYTLIYWDDII